MRRLIAIALGVALAGLGTVALAARNASGTYSRPSGNPVTTLTSITSSWANTLTSDLATEMTDSLSRSGKGGMLAPLRTTDGSVSLPSLSFTNDTNTGFYRIGADEVGLSLGGTLYVDWSALMTTISTPITATSGPVYVSTISATGSNDVEFTSSITVTGAATFLGSTTVPTPVSSTEAANKAYVDAVYAGSIMFGTGWVDSTPTAATVRRVGHVATLSMPGVSAGASSAWASVIVLPAGYRPLNQVELSGTIRDASAAFANYPCLFIIATDGTVSVQSYLAAGVYTTPFAIGSGDLFYGAATYLTADP